MSRVRQVAERIWRLFVDDGPATILLLGWIALIGVVSRLARLDTAAGPLLFAGIAGIAFLSFISRR